LRLLLLLLLARQCVDALVGSRVWSPMCLLLLLLWLVLRVVASLPTCRPWSFSSLRLLVFLSTLCVCVVVWLCDNWDIIAACREKRTKNKFLSLKLKSPASHASDSFCPCTPPVKASLSPGLCVSLRGLVHVESTGPLEPSITLAILAQTEPCLTTYFL
jgi:hypothetical protein